MAYSPAQGNQAEDLIQRIRTLDFKATAVQNAGQILIDDDPDRAITNAAQVSAYVTLIQNRRDARITDLKTLVAGW